MRKVLMVIASLGMTLTTSAWGEAPPIPAAQAPKVTVKELVAGPMAQDRGHTVVMALFTFPGNTAEPARALMTYHERVRINSLTLTPTGKSSYRQALHDNGIRQWIAKGGSTALQMAGPVSVSGPNNRPVLCYPVILHLDRGNIRRSLPKVLCLTYADQVITTGFAPTPAIVQITLGPR